MAADITARSVLSSMGDCIADVLGPAGCSGAILAISADMVDVTNTNMVRNTNTVPIPSTIRFRASDSSCPDSTHYLQLTGQASRLLFAMNLLF